MNPINIDQILCVNGYHGSGYIPAEDRRLLADYVRQLGDDTSKLHAQITALKGELASCQQIKRERDAAVKIIQDARTYLEDLGSPKYALMQLVKWPCAENGGTE